MTTRRDFLKTAAAAAMLTSALPRFARAGSLPRKNLIVVFASGGWDPTHALDPKTDGTQVDIPSGDVQLFGNLPVFTDASRPNVTAFFDAWAPVSVIVNGIYVSSIAHPECRQRILTGTRSETSPDVGAMAAYELGWELPAPYLVLGNAAFTGELASGSTRVGGLNQIVALLDPAAVAAGPYPQPAFLPAAAADAADVRAFVQARAERMRTARGAAGLNQRRVTDFLDSLGRGDLLRANKAGFGTTTRTLALADQRALAVEMIAAGITCSVHVDSGEAWDTHDTNTDQMKSHDDLFLQLKALADDLAGRPGANAGNNLLDETVVAVLSEMGRTPKLNAADGKDHWPTTSALLFGGGLAGGGQAFGASSAALDPEKVDFATGLATPNGVVLDHGAFVAGVLSATGADPAGFLPGVAPFAPFV